MANPMKNGFSTLRTGVFNLMPIRFSEYMVVPAIISYPCFWMIASRSFHVVANFTFIRFSPVLNGQLLFQFDIQILNITFKVAEQKHQSIESRYHRYADVHHRSTIVGDGIVSDHCGKHIVVLVGNLFIGGSDQRLIHLYHQEISSDINHIRPIEGSG